MIVGSESSFFCKRSIKYNPPPACNTHKKGRLHYGSLWGGREFRKNKYKEIDL